MSTAQETGNKATFRRIEDTVNTGDVEVISKAIDEVVAPDALIRMPLPIEATGAQAFRQLWAMLLRGLPDLHLTIEDLVEEGDKVVMRASVTGTHQGHYMGLPPTGKSITYDEIFIWRFAGGRIAEMWGVVDVFSQMQQLGVIPARDTVRQTIAMASPTRRILMSEARQMMRQTAAPGPAAAIASPRLGLALLVIATAQLMVVLDATIVNVALPYIQRALGFSGSGLEWVVNAYALAFGGLMLLGGRAGDLLGRRQVFVTGLVLFSAASLAGGLATSQAWLLAARAVQGAGAAMVAPAALALITTTFPGGQPRNRAMGVYAAMSVAGGAVGLIAGGLLTTYASWRWVLFVNVPIGVAAALAAPQVLSESGRQRGRFDL